MKIDGTNGLLQQYDYQTPTTGFSYTFAGGTAGQGAWLAANTQTSYGLGFLAEL